MLADENEKQFMQFYQEQDLHNDISCALILLLDIKLAGERVRVIQGDQPQVEKMGILDEYGYVIFTGLYDPEFYRTGIEIMSNELHDQWVIRPY